MYFLFILKTKTKMNFLKIILIAFTCFIPWLNFFQIDLIEVCTCANNMMTCVKDLNITFILDFGDLKFNGTLLVIRNKHFNDIVSPLNVTHLNLKKFELSSNQLRLIRDHSFRSLPALNVMSLASNQIEEIEACAFIDLINLKTLDLSVNRLKSLQADTFLNQRFLDTLNLKNNLIETIQMNTFRLQKHLEV